MENKKIKFFQTALIGITILFIASCSINTEKYEQEEEMAIQNFLSLNPDLNFELKPSGLYYLDVLVGTGPQAETHDTFYVKFTARYLGGGLFDTNVGTDDTLIYPVNEGKVIAGLDEGITYMKEGGKSRMLIPSKLAFGSTGTYFIPGYTPLLFDVELVRLKKGPGN
ncbi:MAG: FKBP-type peptidyl-prolyl cis-trans isomerase [Bacteroidales bacterium]|nr:FKBP-type peptidyl-prolyl cis-trans isomerase [Bacteroidales bacterium]